MLVTVIYHLRKLFCYVIVLKILFCFVIILEKSFVITQAVS